MKIFIVEDDKFYVSILEYHLSLNPEFETEIYSSGKNCIEHLYKKPDLVTVDFSFSDMSGSDVLREIKLYNSTLPIIIISGQEDIASAVSLLQEGIYDYLIKTENLKGLLWNIVSNLKEKLTIETKLELLQEEVMRNYDFTNTIKIKNFDSQNENLFDLYSLFENLNYF